MIANRSGGLFLGIAAVRQIAAQSGPFSSGRVAEAAAALVTGTLAVLMWLRARQIATLQAAISPTEPVPTSIRSPTILPASTSPLSSTSSEPGQGPGPVGCSMLRRLCTAVLFGLAAGFLAPSPVAATVFAAAGFACGYVVAGRSAAAKQAKAVQRRLAAAPTAIELFAAGLAAGILPEQAAHAVVDAFGRAGPAACSSSYTYPDSNPGSTSDPGRERDRGPERGRVWERERDRGLECERERERIRDLDQDPLAQVAETFRQAASVLAATADPVLAWEVLRRDPATEPVGTAALRSSRTGAPMAEAVARAAQATRAAAHQAAQGQVRSVAVKAVAPLALCFLPAFVLIGIVPTALGLLRQFQH